MSKPTLKFRAWHKAEEKLCDVTLIRPDAGAFLLGVNPGKDQVIEDLRMIIPAPTDGRFCRMDGIELQQFVSGEWVSLENPES